MKGLLDDRRHAQLSKGDTPAQVHIDDLEAGVGPLSFGKCDVLEISAQSALTNFTMGGHVSGVAWSLNPYVGCIHSCRYCFVPQTLHVERRRWGTYVMVKRNLASVLRDEVQVRERKSVYISTATDPYQTAEAEHRITRGCLEVLAHKDWPVDILTRSPLVVRDLAILQRFSRLRVGLSVPTIDDEARKLIEPSAPPIPVRLKALRQLADAGLEVYANHAPMYPPTNGYTMRDVAEAYKDAGVKWVNASHWKYQSGYLATLWDQLHKTPWADLPRYAADAKRQAADRKELDGEMARVGIPIRTGFFNEPFEERAALPRACAIPLDRFCGAPAVRAPGPD